MAGISINVTTVHECLLEFDPKLGVGILLGEGDSLYIVNGLRLDFYARLLAESVCLWGGGGRIAPQWVFTPCFTGVVVVVC